MAARAAHRGGAAIAGGLGRDSRTAERPVGERGIDVVAAERRVAAGGDDLEHAARHAQERDVEGAAAQVVDRVQALARVVEAVGDRGRGRLADQAQHGRPASSRGVLGRLALGVVEVGGHGDDGAVEVVVEGVLGALAQRRQDLGRDLDRRLDSPPRVRSRTIPGLASTKS